MKRLLVICCIFVQSCDAQLPTVTSGKLERIEEFDSDYITSRHIDVWLPDGYSASKKYSVLYMHDGQMLFDSAITWNRQSWEVDRIAGKLLKEQKIRDVIIVGVWNGGITRYKDYFPQKAFQMLSKIEQDSVRNQAVRANKDPEAFPPTSDEYLKFLVLEVKPLIDKKYPTLADRDHTFIAGSSMGGLISIYALCEYPDVFGGAACLSTHWPGTFTLENNPMPKGFVSYLSRALPSPGTHKIYFDYGDQTLDALYPSLQKDVDSLMQAKGFDSATWKTVFFPGEDHSERAWAKRLHEPLLFLLK